MGSRPDGWWRDRAAARRRLVAELADFGRRQDVESVRVVFDGRRREDEVADAAAAGVALDFAPGGPNAADRVIADLAAACAAPDGLTVVTSDRPLATSVRAVGVEVVGAGAFRRLLSSSPS